ncbi:MAG: DUF2130 domain-containing protein [Eggerthellaceae bacterium]|nr:DUF2130 domain-containing protein [Eggerthellaceae bacterium]
MNEIKCPSCGKVFKADETGFADIIKQVRTQEFEKELHKQEEFYRADKKQAIELAQATLKATLLDDAVKKDAELARLAAKIESDATERQLAVAEALAKVQDEAAKKDARIAELQAKLEASHTEQKLAVTQALAAAEAEKHELAVELKSKDVEKEQLRSSLKEQFETEMKHKDDIIAYKDNELAQVRDMKARLSTKMLGETLEQHCEIEFNKLRPTGFQNAYFEKDTDIKTGSKGDYIFRENDEQGSEILSIMFEMKNQQDETATKKKNEDFLKELDKDRHEKGCEYAILVSLLEPDSDLYSGITDMSHRYPKMYVVRPQFFIPIITTLRNAALRSLEYRSELALVKAQNFDIENFESSINDFKEGFTRNYRLASERFQAAIDEIDTTIKHLEKIKKELVGSENQLRYANDKAEGLSIKKLTRGNPTMTARFKELEKAAAEEASAAASDEEATVVEATD